MIVVTGAAGFIGSCIVSKLNANGVNDLILVDHLQDGAKAKNLEGKKYARYYDKQDFLEQAKNNELNDKIHCIIHMGACSSTTLQDQQYFEVNNFEYTRDLAQWAMKNGTRFIYASSAATYGDGSAGYKDDEPTIRKCAPLNYYGESKQKFDCLVLDQCLEDRVVGLKFFNVFGPNEYHKGDMRSVIAKSYEWVAEKGKINLFKSYKPEYRDGDQQRDFIYVKDAVDVVLFFVDNPGINGIFNVGTGQARTWNDLARALFKTVGKPLHIDYIEMPETLRPKYQYFTQADMAKLRKTGFTKPFIQLEEAIQDYSKYLAHQTYI